VIVAVYLAVLLQAPAAQETPIEDRIAAYLKGNDAARAELLKLGAIAIRPLQKARDKAPEKLDRLIRELKVAAAYPSPVRLQDQFTTTSSMMINLERASDLGPMSHVFHGIGIPLFSDRFDPGRLKSERVVLMKLTCPLDFLEEFCRQTGLDYGYFHNTVVVGVPERLWPAPNPPKVTTLDDAGMARARELVEKLDDDSIEVRESATAELVKLGTGVLSLLEAQWNRKEPEIVSRCAAIVRQLRGLDEGVFGPSACLRQKLPAEDQGLLKRLQEAKPSLSFDMKTITDIMTHLQKTHGVDFEVAGEHGKLVLSMRAGKQSLLDVLSLITQTRDLDFIIKDRKVMIDDRRAIRRMLADAK